MKVTVIEFIARELEQERRMYERQLEFRDQSTYNTTAQIDLLRKKLNEELAKEGV